MLFKVLCEICTILEGFDPEAPASRCCKDLVLGWATARVAEDFRPLF